jgi:mono/diheme cytochrome c family protein
MGVVRSTDREFVPGAKRGVGGLLAGLGVAALAAVAAVCVSISAPIAVQAAPDAAKDAQLKFYHDKVVPIFDANCYRCHGGMNHRGGFQMDTKAGMAKGGHDGAVIVPGSPEKSLLVKLIRHEGPKDDPMDMPPHKDKLSDADIATVEQWVKAGAVMPDDAPKP